jgi:osmotically inducible protein OsmC
MPTRSANARWEGDLASGNGTMDLGTGSWSGPYSAKSRFEEGDGTNPEELIAAAHAGCFSMAFAHELAQAGHTPDSIETTAEVHLNPADGGFAINRIDLRTRASVPGIDEQEFQSLGERAKAGCPVSKALAGVGEITLDATLES